MRECTEEYILNKLLDRVMGLCGACKEPCSAAHGGLEYEELCSCHEDVEGYRVLDTYRA